MAFNNMPPGPPMMPPVSDGLQLPGGGMIPPPGPGSNIMAPPFASGEVFAPQGEFMEVKSFMVDGGDRFGVSTVAFDTQEELLWMGNQGGHVTSYYGQDLQKYTSFQVHENQEVRQIITLDGRILCVTPDSLRCYTKFGRPQFRHMSEGLRDMQCILSTSPNTVIIGGHQPVVIEFDVEAKKEVRQVSVSEPGCALLRHSQTYICAGDTSGKVTLRDPNTLEAEHVLQAHSGTLSDLDVHGHQLMSCGFARRMGSLTVDRFLMIYDLRYVKASAPMQMSIDPMFLRFVPTYTNRICVVSQTGQFQLMEQGVLSQSSMMMYQVQTEGTAINAFDISSTCQMLAFGDAGGYLHVFTSGEHPTHNQFSEQTTIPTGETLEHSININDYMTPLSVIPMQYPTNGKLLSEWPDEWCKRVYRWGVQPGKPTRMDMDIMRGMKIVQNVGYAPNPGNRRRNQMPYKMQKRPTGGAPGGRERKTSVPDSSHERVEGLTFLSANEDSFVVIPKPYRRVEIKYSKLGVEDFDFRIYNKTNFAGLESHVPNAYCNAMLQVLFFIEPLRCTLLNHLCDKEFCLSCELGFLFHMLDSQKGKTCQATNFLRAFRTIPEASALGLVLNDSEEYMGKVNLPRLIQNWNRFILQQIHSELLETEKCKDPNYTPKPRARVTSAPEPPPVALADPAVALLRKKEEKEKEEKAAAEKEGQKEEQKEEKSKESGEESVKDKPSLPAKTEEKKDEAEGADGASSDTSTTEGVSRSDSLTEEPGQVSSGVAQDSMIKRLFGADLENTFTCKCSEVMKREMTASVTDLNYSAFYASGISAHEIPKVRFSEVVQQSLSLEQNTQAWCNVCRGYQPHHQSKTLQSLPDTLSLNCHLENQRDWEFWNRQEELLGKKKDAGAPPPPMVNTRLCRYGSGCTRRDCKFRHITQDMQFGPDGQFDMTPFEEHIEVTWVPQGMRIKLSPDGKVSACDVDAQTPIPPHMEDAVQYELLATVVYIKDSKTGGNLVAHIKGLEPYHQRKEKVTCTQWYLFNDFAIKDIEGHEAVSFSLDWKIPCCIYFSRVDNNTVHYTPLKNPITADVLFANASLVTPRRRNISFIPLDEEDVPAKGDVIGLDAEFVTLNQEEAELRSDGTRSMIKPSQMSVARISCVRGKGPLKNEAFIDDYISTQEQVVDYLTQFSGIQPGDLDASISSKHLTTLKSTYLKMRYLVDMGITFVGHGLKKDFRVINLVVPKDQVIDTVDLFHQPRQRMISLKFLAWYFLSASIQSVTHDSIEDARTALRLHEKYKDMSQESMEVVRTAIKNMYDKGRALSWKIPEDGEGPHDGEEQPGGEGEQQGEQPAAEKST